MTGTVRPMATAAGGGRLGPSPPREESTVRILVTNDDGVGSAGLHALARAVVEAGHEVRVVAPSEDMSGSSAAIGQVHLDRSIDARPVELPGLDGVPAYALDGPPGLCVLADRIGGFGEPSEMVLSGVNPGANTGRAVLHSGTVGGALTGANFGVSGLAVSIAVPSGLAHEATTVPARDDGAVAEVVGSPVGAREGAGRDRGLPEHWDTAARIAASLVGWLADAPRCTVLNVNVPDRPVADIEGVRTARLAPFGSVRTRVVESAADGGRLQLEMRPTGDELPPDCDTALVRAGFVTVTPITGVHLDESVDVRVALAVVEDRAGRAAARGGR